MRYVSLFILGAVLWAYGRGLFEAWRQDAGRAAKAQADARTQLVDRACWVVERDRAEAGR